MVLEGVAAVEPDGQGLRQQGAADVGPRPPHADVVEDTGEHLEHRVAGELRRAMFTDPEALSARPPTPWFAVAVQLSKAKASRENGAWNVRYYVSGSCVRQ